ncbi:MAG: hypothetical protein DHS20C17_20770 [Cyclobacteriaceae bacterium]|nr:MAG: hypothetical protein DHS20C17_20770 [Cyclobacteriaceae bacterium]
MRVDRAVKRKSIICIIIIGLLASCSGEKPPAVEKYFNLPGFLDQQLAILYQEQPEIVKNIIFGDQVENTVISGLDSSQWQKELKIFTEHDINKPVLIDAYSTEEVITDQGGKQLIYRLSDSGNSGILNMEVNFDSLDRVASLSSTFREENLLYGNFREVSLTTGPGGKLGQYSVKGYHKLLLNDTVHYQMEVALKYK